MQVSRRIWGHTLLRLVVMLCPTTSLHKGGKSPEQHQVLAMSYKLLIISKER